MWLYFLNTFFGGFLYGGLIFGEVFWVRNKFEICLAYERCKKFVVKVKRTWKGCFEDRKISFCAGGFISATIGIGTCKTKSSQADISIFMNNQAYCGIIRYIQELVRNIQAYSESCVTLEYSRPWYIQNPGIFRTRRIFRIQSNIYVGVFSENSLMAMIIFAISALQVLYFMK